MDYERAREKAVRSATGNFRRAVRMMRSRDPQELEDGFALLRDIAHEHAPELLVEFDRETGYRTRFLLLELIGESRSPLAFDVLAAELLNDDEVFRSRAEHGLSLLETKEARRVLWQHQNNRAGFRRPDPMH
ncbi:MAG: hypothetical protein QOI74_1678 [Micromonosporaceae bacterium]|nr:hypothetical protein [Micromonosporaceae bacterium]